MEKEQVIKTIKKATRIIFFGMVIGVILYNIYIQNYSKAWDCAYVLVILNMYFDIQDLKTIIKDAAASYEEEEEE